MILDKNIVETLIQFVIATKLTAHMFAVCDLRDDLPRHQSMTHNRTSWYEILTWTRKLAGPLAQGVQDPQPQPSVFSNGISPPTPPRWTLGAGT